MRFYVPPLEKFYRSMPDGIKLLDVGALNFSQYKILKSSHPNIKHYGVDYCDPTEPTPTGYVFKNADLNHNPIPFEDDLFDVIIASHIIEHLNDPIEFFKECVRVLKPGGTFYIEAPSERSLNLKGMPFDYDGFYSLSMYDDPTHTKRPWTPQSFHRLARYYSAIPREVGYVRSTIARLLAPILIPYARLTKNGHLLERAIWLSRGWAAYAFIEKSKDIKGTPPFLYYYPAKRVNK